MKKLFISYKWEGDDKNKWVEKLYEDLRLVGFDAKLDKFEVAPGQSFSDYMTHGIAESDHVLFIITPTSKTAVESGKGALAFEMQMSNARRISGKGEFSIVPILREGNESPTYLSDHRYIDFRNDDKYRESLLLLIKWLNEEIKPPQIGYSTTNPVDIIRVLPILQHISILGWAVGSPNPGEKGQIQLSSDSLLEYTSAINTKESDWWKGFFEWDLVWDEELGTVVRHRLAISEN